MTYPLQASSANKLFFSLSRGRGFIQARFLEAIWSDCVKRVAACRREGCPPLSWAHYLNETPPYMVMLHILSELRVQRSYFPFATLRSFMKARFLEPIWSDCVKRVATCSMDGCPHRSLSWTHDLNESPPNMAMLFDLYL